MLGYFLHETLPDPKCHLAVCANLYNSFNCVEKLQQSFQGSNCHGWKSKYFPHGKNNDTERTQLHYKILWRLYSIPAPDNHYFTVKGITR